MTANDSAPAEPEPSPRLSHQDDAGRPRMVNVGGKAESRRVATAEGVLRMAPSTLDALLANRLPKGDPLTVAQIAGIQAAKRTADLIPLCHPVPLSRIDVQLEVDDRIPGIRAVATVEVVGRTGVEMEALTAIGVALLTTYDMLKAIDRSMRIDGIRLLHKQGGRGGTWEAPGESEPRPLSSG
ncbi:MAG: cyclic pyranopterin monophosphate synthase MoaC [Longimicrobiales bacterium]